MKWRCLFLILLIVVIVSSSTSSLAQSPQTITAENASHLTPLLELNSSPISIIGWHDNNTVFAETYSTATYYDITTGTSSPATFLPSDTTFSPDGTLALVLVYDSPWQRERDFYIYDAITGQILAEKETEAGTYPYTDAIFTPDGTGVILSYDDGVGHDGLIAYANVQALLEGSTTVEYLCTSNRPLILNPFSDPNDLVVALGGANGAVNIWRVDDIHQITTDTPLTTISSETGYSMEYTFADPDTLVTRDRLENKRNVIRWWDINTGTVEREIFVDLGFNSIIQISPDAHYMLVYQSSSNELWDISFNTPTSVSITNLLNGLGSMALSPDSQKVAYLDKYGVLAWLDIATREKHILAEGFNRDIGSTEFNAANNRLLIDYQLWMANILELWNIPEQQKLLALYDAVGTFSPDGHTVAIGGMDGILHFFDADTGDEIRTITDSRFSTGITALLFHPGGHWLACGTADGSAYLIDLDTDSVQDLSVEEVEYSYLRDVTLAFSPSGHLLAVLDEHHVSIWDMTTQQNILYQPAGLIVRGPLLFSPDETRLAIGGGRMLGAGTSGIIRIYDIQAGEEVTAVGSLYMFGEMPDDTEDHCYLFASHSHIYPVYALGFHPNSDYLAAASGDNVALWDIPTAIEHRIGIDVCEVDGVNEMIYSFALPGRGAPGDAHQDDNWDMTLHPTLPLVAFGARGGYVYLWDFTDPHDVQVSALEGAAETLAFSPDGSLLVTGNPTTKFWDMDTLRPIIQNLPNNLVQSRYEDIQFSPDGQYLVTVGDYGQSLTVWGIAQ